MNVFLLHAIRVVIRADSDPARRVLFANLMQARLAVRLAYRVHERLMGTWGSAVLISGYGLAYFIRVSAPATRGARILAAAKHVNARRQIERVAAWVGAGDCSSVRTQFELGVGAARVMSLVAPTSWRGLIHALRIVRVIDRRHGFLVACRTASAIAWYARAKTILLSQRPQAALVSSDSNPEEVGFTAAARALGLPGVFASHAYPTPFSPPLDFSLSILEGQAAVLAHMRKGPIKGDIVLVGQLPFTFAGLGARDMALVVLLASYTTPEMAAATGVLISTRGLLPPLLGLPIMRPYLSSAIEDARVWRQGSAQVSG